MTAKAIRYEFRSLRPEAIFALRDQFVRARSASAPQAGPLGEVVFRVVGPKAGATVQPLPRQPELVITRNESGYFVYYGEIRLPDEEFHAPGAIDDGKRRNWLADGRYEVLVETSAYQPVTLELAAPNPTPQTPIDVDLQPGPGYPFPNPSVVSAAIPSADCTPAQQRPGAGATVLRGMLHKADGAPIEKATVEALDGMGGSIAGLFTTGPTGEWVLALPVGGDTGPVTVRVTPEAGAPITTVANVCLVKGREAVLRETALRGFVLHGGTGVRGATVTVAGRTEQAVTGADGGWTFYLALDPTALPADVDVTATLPSGERQTRTQPIERFATALVETFRFP